MVLEQPDPERCSQRVVDKLGAEITLGSTEAAEVGGDGPEMVLTDALVSMCRFADDATDVSTIVETSAVYRTLRKWLWDDYDLTHVGIDPNVELGDGGYPSLTKIEAHESVADVDVSRPPAASDLQGATYDSAGLADLEEDVEPEELVWVALEPEARTNVTNRYNELQGYCERYPMNGEDYCYDHGPQGGGGKPGNTNPMTHGLYAQRTNYYQSLEDDEKRFIESMVDSWLQDAPFDRDHAAKVNELYRTAIDQHRALNAVDEFVDEDGELTGMTEEQPVIDDEGQPVYNQDGQVVTEIEEHPANLPYSRLDRDVTKKLKELGVLDDSESQQAEATESLAQALSGDSG